jgi:hypothetical protein
LWTPPGWLSAWTRRPCTRSWTGLFVSWPRPSTVKRTVQAAAVIGREFGLRLLTRISEVAAEVQHYLDTLTHAELIHETHFFPELEYIFKHAVTQDVAYQSLLAQRRKELHGAIGRAIEDLYADRLEEHAPILAYHYARSERQDRAVEYALRAGDQAARLYANAEATTYYEQALSMARALPPTPQAQRSEIDAALKLAAVGLTRQHIERDRRNVERARDLAERLQDEHRLAQALYWLGRLGYVLGDRATAIEYAGQSLEIADRLGDEALAAPPVNLMARVTRRSRIHSRRPLPICTEGPRSARSRVEASRAISSTSSFSRRPDTGSSTRWMLPAARMRIRSSTDDARRRLDPFPDSRRAGGGAARA